MLIRHRVLFFVEPYTVRSGAEDFRTPAQAFAQIAGMLAMQPDVQTAMICNPALSNLVPRGVRFFNSAEHGIDAQLRTDWSPKWTAILKGDDIPPWKAFYQSAIDAFKPTLIYLWNKNSLFQNIAWERGIPVLTWEYGGLRTPGGFRISVDPKGFGPDSALAGERIALDEKQAIDAWQWAAEHVHRDALTHHHADENFNSPPGKIHVAVLLQKEDDVNFLLWPAFGSMWEFAERVLKILSGHADVIATVRPHPGALEDYSQRIASTFPTVRIDLGGRDFYQAMLDYDAVVTLNSAAGFEALLCGIPVVALTKGFYRAPPAPNSTTLGIDELLSQVRAKSFWTDERQLELGTFLHRLVEHYSIPQGMFLLPSFHLALIRALAGMGSDEVQQWFAAEPGNLGALVARHVMPAVEAEMATLRTANHRRITEIAALSAKAELATSKIHELIVEINRQGLALRHLQATQLQAPTAIRWLSQRMFGRLKP